MDAPNYVYYLSAKYLTYREFFAIQHFIKLLPFLGILLTISILLNQVAKRIVTSSAAEPAVVNPMKNIKCKERSVNLLRFFSYFSALAFFSINALYLSLLHGFRIISIEFCYTGAITLFSINITLFHRLLRKSKAMLALSLIGAVCITTIGPMLFDNMCQAYLFYPNRRSEYLITSSFTRKLFLPQACPPGLPCHVYATLPENTSDSVCVIIINSEREHAETREHDNCFATKVFSLKGVEEVGQRNIHSAYLFGMISDTLYNIQIYYENKLQVEELYRTLPQNTSEKNITIVSGGDIGFLEMAYQTGKQAASYNPDLIVLGGDLVYDNGMDSCYYTWDQFFGIFEDMNKVKGSLIPLILAIGNHDAGVEALTIRKVKQDEYGPPYFTFFPQHSRISENGEIIKEVPELEERKSYFYHIVGDTLQLSLDSGYIAGYNGLQLEWMKRLNDQHHGLPKFAYYHVPIYWAFGLWDPVAAETVLGMQFWVPEFDRSKYMSAWEHHAHLLKRTKPLRGSIPRENGTIYLGEGCWGVNCLGFPLENSTGIFETFHKRRNHFWLVQLGKSGVSYTAIDIKNRIVDYAEQAYEGYNN